MKIPFVKEWGSWVVFASSSLAAAAAAYASGTSTAVSASSSGLFRALAGMFFLINAKNPLASCIRSRFGNAVQAGWLAAFSVLGIFLLFPVLKTAVPLLAVSMIPVATYSLMLWMGKEHHITAELNGFALLALSAPIVYFVLTSEISWRIYIAVLIFFWAGVFKVRVRIRKSRFYKTVMVIYCLSAAVIYYAAGLPVIIIAPLLENIVSSIRFREQRLQTTGYTELAKSVIFVILLWRFWPEVF